MLRVPMTSLARGERELDAAQTKYIARVHRLAPGDRFIAFDPSHAIECDAEVLTARRVRLGEVRSARTIAPRDITWIHGHPKGDKSDAIVRDATELGATRIVFVQTTRVVSKGGDKRVSRWERIAAEAARQCGRGDAPTIAFCAKWIRALDLAAEDAHCACLDPTGVPLGEWSARAQDDHPIVIAAGPEGGFTDDEIAAAREHHFAIASLGALVLRTETVPAAVLGAFALLHSSSA